jgi:hypothetical protein
MRNANASGLTLPSPSPWKMPIRPQTYPDRNSHLTQQEKALMEQYITVPVGPMTGGRARNILRQLVRFEAPFLDTVRLTPHIDTTLAAARRHLFTYMVQTEVAFWAWSKEIWIEVIESASGRTHSSGPRFWMLLLA